MSLTSVIDAHTIAKRICRRVDVSLVGCKLADAVRTYGPESPMAIRLAHLMIDLSRRA